MWLVVGGWWLMVGGWWLVVGGWWLVVGGWWLVAGGWWLVGCGASGVDGLGFRVQVFEGSGLGLSTRVITSESLTSDQV